MIFIDFRKASDSVRKEAMWKILKNYGVPEETINIVKCLNDGYFSGSLRWNSEQGVLEYH